MEEVLVGRALLRLVGGGVDGSPDFVGADEPEEAGEEHGLVFKAGFVI